MALTRFIPGLHWLAVFSSRDFAAQQAGGDEAAEGLLDAAAGDESGLPARNLSQSSLLLAGRAVPVAGGAGGHADLVGGLFERQAADVGGCAAASAFRGCGPSGQLPASRSTSSRPSSVSMATVDRRI
jgi:hypothetical protein